MKDHELFKYVWRTDSGREYIWKLRGTALYYSILNTDSNFEENLCWKSYGYSLSTCERYLHNEWKAVRLREDVGEILPPIISKIRQMELRFKSNHA